MPKRTFRIPGDLPNLEALGAVAQWTPEAVERRLLYLEACVEHEQLPDARGKRLEPPPGEIDAWESVPAPEELEDDMADLATSVAHCREHLDAGDLDAARERLRGVESLVKALNVRLANVRRKRGAKARRGNLKCSRIYAWILQHLRDNPGATNEEVERAFPSDDDHLYRRSNGDFVEGDATAAADMSVHGFHRYLTKARKELGLI